MTSRPQGASYAPFTTSAIAHIDFEQLLVAFLDPLNVVAVATQRANSKSKVSVPQILIG